MPITLCHFDLSARDGWLTPTKHSGIKPVINDLCTSCIRRSASSHSSEIYPKRYQNTVLAKNLLYHYALTTKVGRGSILNIDRIYLLNTLL